jgi:hypothetical protein
LPHRLALAGDRQGKKENTVHILSHSNADCNCLEIAGDSHDCPVHYPTGRKPRTWRTIAGVIAILIGAALIGAAIATAFGG